MKRIRYSGRTHRKHRMKSESESAYKNRQADLEIEFLRKQREIIKLRQEIKQMGIACEDESVNRMQTTENRNMNYKSVEDSIVKFDGDDRAFSVGDFFRNFDDVMDNVNANESFKFLCLRNSLVGSWNSTFGFDTRCNELC